MITRCKIFLISIRWSFKALGALVSEKDLDSGRIYPPIPTIHEVTVKIAAHLADHLFKQKQAWQYPGNVSFQKLFLILSIQVIVFFRTQR